MRKYLIALAAAALAAASIACQAGTDRPTYTKPTPVASWPYKLKQPVRPIGDEPMPTGPMTPPSLPDPNLPDSPLDLNFADDPQG